MTWRELQQAISEISGDQLDNEAMAWGESIGLTHICLESADEAMYYDPDWGDEGCGLESDIEPENLPDCIKVCDKGYYYLWVE